MKKMVMIKLTKWMMPAAVNQTEMKMEMSWASLKKDFLDEKLFFFGL